MLAYGALRSLPTVPQRAPIAAPQADRVVSADDQPAVHEHPLLPSPLPPAVALQETLSDAERKNRDAVAKAQSGDVRGAIVLLREAHRLEPENELVAQNLQAALINTGFADLEQEHFSEAIGWFIEALGLGDRNEIQRGLGYAYYRIGNLDLARASLERVVASGADTESLVTLGRVYLERRDQARALEMFEKALAAGADSPGLADTVARLRREAAIEDGYHELGSSHFKIKFEGHENTEAGRLVLNSLEDAYRRIGARFAYYPLEPVEVILYPDEAFREVTNTPHWSGAVYDGRIKLPVGGLDRGTDRLNRTLRHEYAHAAIVTLSRGKVPVWLNEGLAQVSEETDDPGRTGRLRAALDNEGLMKLTDLEGGFTRFDRAQASLAYSEGYAAASYLLEKKGGYNVRRLLEAMATAKSVDDAFRQALSMSYAEFEAHFLADIERRLR